ncbi:MAG: hypothetical protein K2X86_02705 [Cytophagaceae bacterium]|nr:hypothetical protein [Cytophagaceae bacterium]
MKSANKILIAASGDVIILFFFLVINFFPENSFAAAETIKKSQRTEEYAIITCSKLDKDNLGIGYGHIKKEVIPITKKQAVVEPVINMMHSMNSQGWELVNNESFPYLNIVGYAGNIDSDAYHTIIFVMKRKLTHEPNKE